MEVTDLVLTESFMSRPGYYNVRDGTGRFARKPKNAKKAKNTKNTNASKKSVRWKSPLEAPGHHMKQPVSTIELRDDRRNLPSEALLCRILQHQRKYSDLT